MPSFAPAVEHLFTVILRLNDDEINLLYTLKYIKWTDVTRRLQLSQLDKELANKDIPMSVYKGLVDWLLYYKKHHPAINTIVDLDDSIFDDKDMDKLKHIHRSKTNPVNTT